MKKSGIICLVLGIGLSIHAQYKGKIVKVYDGNTFWVELADGKTDSVKLYGIDCPELEQQYGVAAKKKLEGHLHREVDLEYKGRDTKNYLMAIVKYDTKKEKDVILNEEMIREGYAWKNKYTDDKGYEKLEKEARKNKAGLWRNADPVAPWEFRKNNKK